MDRQTSGKSTQAPLGAWMSRGMGAEQRGFGCRVEWVLNSGDCVNPRVKITRGNPSVYPVTMFVFCVYPHRSVEYTRDNPSPTCQSRE